MGQRHAGGDEKLIVLFVWRITGYLANFVN